MSNNYDNYDENSEQLIQQAGETIFENIYKNCEHEIKDEIITKLLLKIKQQNKKIESLEKENKKIKDNFIYVLKRILSTKDEYCYYNRSNNFILNNSTSRNKTNNSRNASYSLRNDSKEIYNTNYSIIDPYNKNKIKYDININNSYDNLSVGESSEENQKNDIKEAKAKKYLNALYRNNFNTNPENPEGVQYSNFINKNMPLYEELFPKQEPKKYIYTENDYSYESPYRSIKDSAKRNRSSCFRNKNRLDDIEKQLIKQYGNRDLFYQKIKNSRNHGNNSVRNHENNSISDRKNNTTDKKNRYHNYKKAKNSIIQNYKFKKNERNNEHKKNKNNLTFLKRSPYLINKF